MPNYYQGTIRTLADIVSQEKQANLMKETPQYKQALENLMQSKLAFSRQQAMLEQLKTMSPEQIPTFLAQQGEVGPYLTQQQTEQRLTSDVLQAQQKNELEVNKVIETFENLKPEDIQHVRDYGSLPKDALPRLKIREKPVYDPFTRALLSKRGAEAGKAEVELTGVEAISSDITDVLDTFRKIPNVYKGPLQGRTVGQVGKLGQFDPNLATFEDTKELTLSNIAKKLGGEVGVLTDRDIARIKNALPALRDTEDTANLKIKFVLNYIDRRVKAKQKVANMTASGIQIENTQWYDPKFNAEKIPVGGKGKTEVKEETPPQPQITPDVDAYLKGLGL